MAGLRANEGEAALYGVHYDDTEYDYMQHLRPIGGSGDDGIIGHLVEAPRRNDGKGKGKARQRDDLAIRLREEGDRAADIYGQQSYREYLENTVQEEGLKPDMDPALREVLEALEDDAYVEETGSTDGDGGDFMDNLLNGTSGDYRDSEPFDDDEEDYEEENDDPSSAYASQVAKYKAKRPTNSDSDDDYDDEDRDTLTNLRPSMQSHLPRRATGPNSMASSSAFSMSSSSMFRNEGLRTLDDRFDQVEAMYADSDDDDDTEEDAELPEEVNDMFDEFLEKYAIVGKKMVTAITRDTADPLDELRTDVAKLQILETVKRQNREARKPNANDMVDLPWPEDIRDRQNKWDCETILSTYSNLENHPRILSIRKTLDSDNGSSAPALKKRKPINKIAIDPRTGFPISVAPDSFEETKENGNDSDTTMGEESAPRQQAVGRSRNETPEEKRARKAEVKAERQARRQEKSATRQTFGTERKRQLKGQAGKLGQAADVAKGNTRGIEVIRLS